METKKTKLMFVTWSGTDDTYPVMVVPSVYIKRKLLLAYCKIVGHNPYTKNKEFINDSGFPVCQRCQSHAYYDAEEWVVDGFLSPIFYKLSSFFWKITNPLTTCPMCGKPNWYGNHDQCIPF
jgi:hypothetical protein